MAKIPWWMWLGVGAAMYFISVRSDKLGIFMYVGLFFVVIGIFKILVRFMVGKKKDHIRSGSHYESYCPYCRHHVSREHRFCPYCGTRL